MAELFGDTANDGQMSDLEDTLGGSEDTGLDGDGAIPGDAAADDEPLGNPADFPPELQGHWSRMSRAYQARLAELRQRESELDSVQQRAQLVDRFNQDPHGTLQQLASQYGYQLDRPGQTPQSSSGNPSADIPPEVLRAAQHAFADAPDLQFLAPYVARALAPLQQQQQQQQQESRHSQATQAYQHEVEALNQIAPGWEQHEAEMSERLSFIRQAVNGGPLRHPKYGSILQMLYQWTVGNGQSQVQAGRRMADAVRNRTARSSPARTPRSDIQDQIREAKTMQEQVALAMQDAAQELGVRL